MATLYINKSESRCGECGKPAIPSEETHATVPGLMGYRRPVEQEGCGVKWESVSSDYSDFAGLHDSIRRMRPDLEPDFFEPFEQVDP